MKSPVGVDAVSHAYRWCLPCGTFAPSIIKFLMLKLRIRTEDILQSSCRDVSRNVSKPQHPLIAFLMIGEVDRTALDAATHG